MTLRAGGSGILLRGMLASYGVTGVHFNSGKWIHEHSIYYSLCISMGFPGGSDSEESICDARDLRLIPGLGRSPGEGRSLGEGNPLQHSWQENAMDREAWWATVPGVVKSLARLSD